MYQSRVWTYGLFFLAWFCWSSLLMGAQGANNTDPVEVEALLAIKRNLIDPNNNLSNWNQGDPCKSKWTGVLCFNTTLNDGFLHVQQLLLLNLNLSGSLSPELGRLSNLTILDFMWNNISGTIPKEIGNITSLVLLLLNGNQLTGSLPEELGYLPNLDRIQIDENQISGPIPKSFANLNETRHFHMNNNSISGQIPSELSILPKLVYFLLDNNNLSGSLPSEFSKLPKLKILQLDNNNFEGSTIPASYGNVSHLLKMSLRNCSLQGPIPDLSRIPNLGYLDLSSNQLNGSIPPAKLSENITTIILSNNNLTGTIPAYFSDLPHLQKLLLSNNALNGSIPSAIWQNRTLTGLEKLTVDLQYNDFSNITGNTTLPPNVTLWLQGNRFCPNPNIVHVQQFCGSRTPSDNEDDSQSSTNSTSKCGNVSCPPSYEVNPNSPTDPNSPAEYCICAAPLLVGYRLKSPGFSYFLPYRSTFEEGLTAGLDLFLYQLELYTFAWEIGPRLRMYLKFFPDVNSTDPSKFNTSEVQRIMGMFSGWDIPHSDLFGPYELLITLADVYKNVHGSNVNKRVGIIVGTLLPTGMLILGIALALHIWKKKHQTAEKMRRNPEGSTNKSQKEDLELPLFDLATIANATDNFAISNKLGQGGFGSVYKGVLKDGQEIAVKRLSSNSRQGVNEFKNEINYIAKLQHRNLVKLQGCCIEEDERMLIYEFMPNKSLDFFIFDQTKSMLLDWSKRFQIINGITRGLLYLHQDSRLRIIHRDLKADNILLDSDMNPKISDFGLARSFGGNEIEANTKKVVGTYGYMSPEYAIDGLYSLKSDVFSFGVMMLEIVSGKRNRGFCHPDHHLNLLGHAWRLNTEDRPSELIDESIRDSCNLSEVLRSIHVGLLCVQRNPEDRPSMSAVVLMLGGEGTLLQPKVPGFFNERNVVEANSSSKNHKPCSANECTITLLEAR